MLYKVKGENGDIKIGENVIAQIVMNEADKMLGDVLLCNKKGKLPNMFRDGMNAVNCTSTNTGVHVNVYVIINFGNSITLTMNKYIANLERSFDEYLELKPASISVQIKGMKLREKIVPRDIVATKKRNSNSVKIVNNKIKELKESIEANLLGLNDIYKF